MQEKLIGMYLICVFVRIQGGGNFSVFLTFKKKTWENTTEPTELWYFRKFYLEIIYLDISKLFSGVGNIWNLGGQTSNKKP